MARRAALKAKLDAACARMEAEAMAQADAERPDHEARKAAYDAKKGRRGRPPPEPKPQRRIVEPWRLAMKAKPESDAGKARYRKRKQTVEPVFGIIKSAMGFTRFHLRGLQNLAAECLLVALAYNGRRLHRLNTA